MRKGTEAGVQRFEFVQEADLRIERGADLQRFEYTQVHMGVQARIVLYAPDASTARAAARKAFDRIASLDEIMSDYRSDSEVMRLVRRAGDGPVEVSKDLFEVLRISQRIARQSGGAFDVTVGPLVRLWREARKSGELPESPALDAARSRAGFERLKLNPESRTAELATADMLLDLGGIAKGYAADAAIAALDSSGIGRALIEFGGDIVVSGPPPGQRGWHVTVPLADSSGGELVLFHEAVSTSGDTQQFVKIDGTRYSHVVDPRTGVGLTSRVAVTVVAPNGVLSDALATALSVMRPDAGRRLIAREYPEVEAYFRFVDEP